MKPNLPLIRRTWRRLRAGRGRHLQGLAERQWVIWPEETLTVRPALHLDGALERVTRLSPFRSWPVEKGLIDGGEAPRGASVAYQIPRVDVAGAFLYAGPWKDKPGFGRESLLLRDPGPWVHLESANLVTSWSGSHFFGTLLLDDFPLELIDEASGRNVTVHTKAYPHEAGYRELLSLGQPPRIRFGHVDRLTVYSEPAHNRSRAARLRELRSRLRARFAGTRRADATRVYIKRGKTGEPRRLENETEIEDALQSLGFDVVEPDRLEADEIARRTLDARIVVGVEGSHLSNAIFTIADDGALLVLQPPDRFALAYKEFADCLDLRYGFVVGHPSTGGFTIQRDEVDRMIALLA